MKVSISQSNYIPWKGYFDLIRKSDVFVLYDDMQFTKRDWRNRNQIKTHNGLLWLSIPVLAKGKFFQKINETEINGNDWAIGHWRSIRESYSKAPFFKENEEFFADLYENAKELKLLSEVNSLFIKSICSLLKIETRIISSSEFELKDDRNERLLHICQCLNADTYISGPAAQAYMDINIFNRSKINVEWMDYSHYQEYKQLHGSFTHNVTILDLIFNTGRSLNSL